MRLLGKCLYIGGSRPERRKHTKRSMVLNRRGIHIFGSRFTIPWDEVRSIRVTGSERPELGFFNPFGPNHHTTLMVDTDRGIAIFLMYNFGPTNLYSAFSDCRYHPPLKVSMR